MRATWLEYDLVALTALVLGVAAIELLASLTLPPIFSPLSDSVVVGASSMCRDLAPAVQMQFDQLGRREFIGLGAATWPLVVQSP